MSPINLLTIGRESGEQPYRTFRQGVRLEEVAATLGISVIDKSQEVAGPCKVDQGPITVLMGQVQLDEPFEEPENKVAGRAS